MAKVTRKKVDLRIERQILIGMITSDLYLKNMVPIYHADLLEVAYGPIIAKWCLDYFKEYDKAPGKDIEESFDSWLKTKPNDELVKYIEDFLNSLSDEYEHAEKFNVAYLMDKTVEHFKKRSLKNLKDDIEFCLEQEKVDEAEEAIATFHKVEKVISTGIDPFDDEDAIREGFKNREEPLFKLPGELGKLMNSQLVRGSLVTFMAPEKRGKTWMLQYLSTTAHRQRCNVALFLAGDMSQDQQTRRIHISLSKKSDDRRYCGTLYIPVLDCEKNQNDTCNKRQRKGKYCIVDSEGVFDYEDAPNHIPCTCCQRDDPKEFKGAVWWTKRDPVEPLTWREALAAGREYKKKIRAKGFKLDAHPNDSLSISKMRRILKIWEETEGFVPDVIVCDYMDILEPEENSGHELRHQENKKWKAARKLSQELHCCFISATQSDAESALVEFITRANFSEDKRKFAHVTAMYAMNQYGDEKRKGILRIAPLVVREDAFDEKHNVHILQCLQIGAAYISSY